MEEDFPFETIMNGFLHSNCTSPEQEYILIQSREESILLQVQPKVFPYRTACFGRLTTLSSLAAGQLVVSQTPRERRLVKWWRCCCRPFRLLVELAAKYTPPFIVSKYTPAPGLCSLNAENRSRSIFLYNQGKSIFCCKFNQKLEWTTATTPPLHKPPLARSLRDYQLASSKG